MTHPENRSRPEPCSAVAVQAMREPVPIDLRQASRGENVENRRKESSGGAPGIGIGSEGDPAFTVSERQQGIVFHSNGSHWDDPSNAHPTLNQSFNTGAIGYSNQEIFSRRGSGLVGVPNAAADATRAVAFKASHFTRGKDGAPQEVSPPLSADADKGDQDTLVCKPIAFSSKDYGADAGSLSPTLRSGNHDASHANGGVPPAVVWVEQVRRLTPTECERLQGFPDGYTNIPMPTKMRAQKKRETDEVYAAYLASVPEKRAADGPRYKALGNSMAVPVMRWIGERIQMVENGRGRGNGI